MATKLKGTIARINLDHSNHYLTFMLENDKNMYRLVFGRFLRRPELQPLALTQVGDIVEITYSPSNAEAFDGTLKGFENQTLGVTAAFHNDQL